MRIVGLELAGDVLRGAVVERRFGWARRLTVARWPVADTARTAAMLRHAAAVRIAVPAQLVTHRWLTLPFRSARQLAATAPLELLAQLPYEPTDVVVGWHRTTRSARDSTLLAAATRGATLEQLLTAARLPSGVEAWLGPLAAWSLVPANAGDVALVIADGQRSSVSVRRAGRVVGLRGLDTDPVGDGAANPMFVDEVRRTLAVLAPHGGAVVIGGADASATLITAVAEHIDDPVASLATLAPAHGVAADPNANVTVVGLALARDTERLCFDDPRRVAPARVPGRVAGLAAAAALAACADLGLYRHRLVAQDAALQAAIAAEAAAVLPGVALVAPRAQLEAALHQGPDGDVRFDTPVLDTLREASARLPSDIRLEVDELVVDGASFRLHGRTDSYQHVDALRRALAGARALTDVRADDTHTGVDGGTVEFTLQATRRTVGGTPS